MSTVGGTQYVSSRASESGRMGDGESGTVRSASPSVSKVCLRRNAKLGETLSTHGRSQEELTAWLVVSL